MTPNTERADAQGWAPVWGVYHADNDPARTEARRLEIDAGRRDALIEDVKKAAHLIATAYGLPYAEVVRAVDMYLRGGDRLPDAQDTVDLAALTARMRGEGPKPNRRARRQARNRR